MDTADKLLLGGSLATGGYGIGSYVVGLNRENKKARAKEIIRDKKRDIYENYKKDKTNLKQREIRLNWGVDDKVNKDGDFRRFGRGRYDVGISRSHFEDGRDELALTYYDKIGNNTRRFKVSTNNIDNIDLENLRRLGLKEEDLKDPEAAYNKVGEYRKQRQKEIEAERHRVRKAMSKEARKNWKNDLKAEIEAANNMKTGKTAQKVGKGMLIGGAALGLGLAGKKIIENKNKEK